MSLHLERSSGFHPGETALHALLHIPRITNPTSAGLPANYTRRVSASPLVAIGALDDENRPWTTVWGGEAGFATPLAHGVLAVESVVDARHDPVAAALLGIGRNGQLREEAYHISREELESGQGKIMSALSIDLATRDRVKLAGRLVVGTVKSLDDRDDVANVQMAMLVEESLGNCPKYLNKRNIRPHASSPRLTSARNGSPRLSREALALLAKADLFFLSSTNGCTMDTNHRGGGPGFVRVLCNDDEGTQIAYPEYSGNRLYQTLGNLHLQPRVGLCVPNFETGDVLYLTGEATIFVGPNAAKLAPRAKLAVKIRVVAARFVCDGLPFRGDEPVDYSPYNPPVPRSNLTAGHSASSTTDRTMATLVKREVLAPSIARFTFKLEGTQADLWKPGQHVTLDFSEELDVGWSHMRDDNPGSLNDDFVRTFTISSVPSEGKKEFQITVRRHGAATALLWRWNLRVPLEVPVLGFGGAEEHRVSEVDDDKIAVFVAAGVGITPALAQVPALVAAGRRFRVLWSLKREDLNFAEDVFRKVVGLPERTVVFVSDAGEEGIVEKLRGLRSEVVKGRRIAREDVLQAEKTEGVGRKFYVCTGSEMLKAVLTWVEGEDVAHESFNY